MVSRTAIHTVRALAWLATVPEGRFVGTETIAGHVGAPPNYLGKLLQNVHRAGLVESRKGVGGGFRLARAPESISLFDVLTAVEPVSRFDGCFLGIGACSETDPCAVHDRWSRLRDDYVRLTRESSIADLDLSGSPERSDV